MSRYYVALGSNVGDRLAYLRAALRELKESGATVVRTSAVYETPPWGKTDQPAFLNAVALVESDLSPTDFLALLQAIEAANERTRDVHWGPRTLDLDIIYAEGVQCDSAYLTLPHPYFWERAFVLVPLRDVAAEFTYRGETIARRIAALPDAAAIREVATL